jgi:hypothetical protein
VVKPVKTVANLGITGAQRVTNGWKPADPESSPVGRFVKQADRLSKDALGIKQDEQRRPEDLFWQQMGEMATTSVAGGVVAKGLVPAAAFTTGAFRALSPIAQQALRWTAGVGTESFVSTALTDNRQGNVANAFGENAPLAVQPGDDMVSALGKSLIPNAGAEIALGLGFLGIIKAAGRGLEGFDNVRRRQSEGRAAQEQTNARNFTKEEGLQEEGDGEYGFTEQAKQPTPAAPAPEAAPAAPPTKQQAEDALLGPKDEPAAAPAEEELYPPELPEVDTAVMAADRLDDEQLRATAQGTGPVLPELERQLTEQKTGFQLQEGLTPEVVAAPTDKLATPVVPYEDQWSQLPNQTLFSLASPANNPELFDIISKMTGRTYDEFAWTDVVDGLSALKDKGTTIIPSRVMGSGNLVKTADVAVDAQRFQFKDNVNAAGQQKGNSLDGVEKWNTDAEGVIQTWTDPMDGKTYVVNGHNRLAKAKELGIPTLQTQPLLAQTAEQARMQGAISNIADGKGTAFDAAKIIREKGIQDVAGLDDAGIPLKEGQGGKSLGVQGLALSKLPGDLFQQAVDGALPMGRALALGGSGLDPADMIRVAGLGAKKDISERGFAELVQMASSAPKVADATQGGIPGMDEWLKDSSVLEKAELSAKVRAELISNKNLFGKVGKSKAAQALANKGGTQVNQGQVLNAADVARGVLDEFDRDKYLTGTPISELLNQGAADIAAGAKPAVIAKRILQQLEVAAEAAPPVVKAEPSLDSVGPARWESWSPEEQQQKAVEAQGLVLSERVLANRQKYQADHEANQAAVERYNDENPGSNSPNELTEEQFIAKYGADESTHPQLMHKGGATPKQLKDLENHNWAQEYLAWYGQKTADAPMTPQERKKLKAQVVKRAIENGEVRPSATPLPDLPDPPQNLDDPAALIADEARLAEEYGTQDVIAGQLAMDAKRQAMGWGDMSLDQKKANGMLDEWERPQKPVGDSLEDRAAYAREQRMAAEAAGDTTLAREWQNAERRLERDRISQAQQRQATSQTDMFGVGAYDNSTPLLNNPPPAPEPGVKRFFHGAAGEFKLAEGGEFESGEMNIYGQGLYSTDSLNTAGKYQKKNKAKGAQANGVTYEVVEKKPVKFFDLDAPATPDVLNKLRDVAGYDSMTELVETAINELDGTPSLTQVFDEMRAYSRELDVPAHEIQSTWHELSLALEKDGYGGFTHQGGHLAGRGKELHQVRIYWDPANSVDIYKVDADGNRVAVETREAGVPAPAAGFELPKGLADLKPRYGYRDLNFEVSFGNDFDRAAFSLAGDANGTSAKAAKYRQAFVDAGYDLKEVVAHGQKVKAALKAQAQSWKPDPENRSIQALELPAQPFKGSNAPAAPAGALDPADIAGLRDTTGLSPEEAAIFNEAADLLEAMDASTTKGLQAARDVLDKVAASEREFMPEGAAPSARDAAIERLNRSLEAPAAARPPVEPPTPATPAIEIPAGASRKITARTGESRITSAAESLLTWSSEPFSTPMSIDQARDLVRAKGAILDPDAIPGLDMEKAREDRLKGRPSPEVQAAYKQFYGIKPDGLSPLSDIDAEGKFLGLRDGPLPFMDMPTSEAAKTRQALEAVFTDAVKRITGNEDVAFHGYTGRSVIPAEHGGDGVRTGIRKGFYDPMTDMVNVMGLMDRSPGDLLETTFHESWHRIQYTLLTLKDMEIFDSVFGKVRVNDLSSMRSASGKASLEKQAYAAQVVAAYRAEGKDAVMEGVRAELIEAMDENFPLKDGRSWKDTLRGEVGVRIIQGIYKVMDLIERVNNGIRRRGFESVQSMFEKAYSGELAKTRAWDSVAQLTTPDQKARLAKLNEWRADNQKGISEINQMVASIDEQINALKSQAMKGGC